MAFINVNLDAVDTPSIEWARMYDDWELIHDLLAGTRQMRHRAERWLPKEPKEKHQNYLTRLNRSILYNGLKDTVRQLTAKPFGRPVTIEGLSDQFEALSENMDLRGSGATAFTRDLFKSGVTYGLVHVFVDHPRMPEGASKAVDKKVKPFFRMVTAPQLVNWTSETAETGEQRLTEVRFREVTVEPRGKYGSVRVHWMYVYTPTEFEIWRSEEPEATYRNIAVNYFQSPEIEKRREWRVVDSGTMAFKDAEGKPAIPMVTIYFNRSGYMTAEAPLMDLAWMNLAHWQSFSDQRNILRFSRLAQLFFRGFTKDDMKDMESMSVNQAWRAKDPQADVKYVEHTGAAIGAGEDDLKKLEERMEVLGMRPLIERTGDSTATGVVANEARSSSDVLAWIEATEDGMRKAFEFAHSWKGEELPEDFDFNVYSDFAVGIGRGEDFKQIQEMRANGDLSREPLHKEAKRRGILAETVDVDEEEERIATDGLKDMEDDDGGTLLDQSKEGEGGDPEEPEPIADPSKEGKGGQAEAAAA